MPREIAPDSLTKERCQRSTLKEKDKAKHQREEIEKLQDRIKELEAMEEAHSRLEKELGKRTEELEQRIRETNCLYEVSRLIEEKDLSLNDIMEKTVSVLSSSLGHHANRQVRVTLENRIFDSEKPTQSSERLSCDLVIHGKNMGLLDVYYNEFGLEEGERQLVATVGGLLGRIIEQKQTEKTLLENERSFRTLVENSPTGIFIVQNGRIVYENPEEKRLSGPLSQLFRKGDLSNIHPEDVTEVREGFKKIMAGEVRNLDIDFRFFADESTDMPAEMKWVHCRASLIDYMGGEALLVNKLDMTRTKELEFLLITEDKMASLGRVASGMAHEIRNPLSGINIYLSNLEKIIDDSEGARKAKEIIGEIQSASNRIESVIRRVMDFSKPSEPKFLQININQPILNAINFSSVTLRKAGIEVNMSLAEDLPQCDADPHLIEQVILNLITNAKEAMKKTVTKKAIHVSSSLRSDQITVTVSDVGPGIPLYMRKRIFDPFYTTKDGNTGIGLSLCYRIIVDHGGSLTVRDSDLGGAEFKIELPLKREKKAL
jgi:PAS domain S-box-containing protein